jgi:DNA-binding response OmpR family regulator
MQRTVAVIEDDPAIRDLLNEVLQADGFDVLTEHDGNVDRIRRSCESAGVFLIDLMLPGRTGIDVAVGLHEAFPDRPLLAMSASRVMLDAAAASGMFHALFAKPFDLDQLVDEVRATTG